jgi:hypothetical protein
MLSLLWRWAQLIPGRIRECYSATLFRERPCLLRPTLTLIQLSLTLAELAARYIEVVDLPWGNFRGLSY